MLSPEPEMLVTVDLQGGDGDGTLLTLIHEQFIDEAARDSHNQAAGAARWSNWKKYLSA